MYRKHCNFALRSIEVAPQFFKLQLSLETSQTSPPIQPTGDQLLSHPRLFKRRITLTTGKLPPRGQARAKLTDSICANHEKYKGDLITTLLIREMHRSTLPGLAQGGNFSDPVQDLPKEFPQPKEGKRRTDNQ